MKVSLSLVKHFTDVDVSTDELVKLATERLGGVEGYEEIGKQYDGIVVARVVSCQKHPNADKLSLCKIDDDKSVKDVERDKDGYVQVVCGAVNVREGLLVAWIPPGSIVPQSYGEKDLFVLEARELRGQLSNGMLASPRELGINYDHDGILELDEGEAKPGQLFKELYELDDVIIDVENKMFTHRPDCFGQLGVAREIAGIQHKAFTSPDWYKLDTKNNDGKEVGSLKITNQIPELCPRYLGVVIDNIKVAPSPIWLQSYLRRLGIRPINNVVDVTNYIMILTAQPLHAFDFDKIAENSQAEIVVRKPNKAEKITLLDGKGVKPHDEAILICNHEKPIALGGVMGGGNSEVEDSTIKIVLECATFDMYSIRKTSMIHGIFTDAVTRFNKGQPATQLMPVILKAIDLLVELTGGKQASDIVDSNPEVALPPSVEVTTDFINSRLGSKFKDEDIIKLLENVEFKVFNASGPLNVTPPFWRTDIELPEDVVEEVGRLYGFSELPLKLPMRTIKPATQDRSRELKNRVRSILARAGANEVLGYSFVHGNLLNKSLQKPDNSYKLRNALSPDLQYYRQTLTPSLLDKVHPNIKAGFDEFAIYEIGKTHNKLHGQDEEGLPGELDMMALTYASKNSKQAGYYHARHYLEFLGSSLGLDLEFKAITDKPGYPVTAPFELARSAYATVKGTGTFLGIVGEFKPEIVRQFKLPAAAAGFEIGMDHLEEAMAKSSGSQYRQLSRYPSTEQDITLRVNNSVSYADLETCLTKVLSESDYQTDLRPQSIYQKDGDKTKNITFTITLSHPDRTLTIDEASKLIEQLSWQAHQQLKAEQV